MKKILIAVVAIVIVLGIYLAVSYNGLVALRENATSQWQQVETQYQRRFDLIPNLVESVKGIMNQEQKVFSDLAEARTRYAGANTVSERAAAAGEVETSLGRLLAVVENYPNLRSSETVNNLMAQLEGTENRVSVERQRYNDSVRVYQVAIKRFPRSIVAAMFGFEDLEYFQADNGAEQAPKVNF